LGLFCKEGENMTANDVWEDIKGLFDRLSKKGVLTDEQTTKDLELRAIKFISKGQREMYYQGNYFEKFSYISKPHENELADNFDIKEFKGEDYATEEANGQAYHFKVDNDATVKLQELIGDTWTDLQTISATSVNGWTTYKGTFTTSRKVRLLFTGTYYYRYTNMAIWDIPFNTDDVPDYDAWVKVDMPDDFMNLNNIVEESGQQYVNQGDRKFEGQKELYVSYDFDGEIRITYKPVPPVVTSLDDTLVLDDVHSEVLAYYAAAKLAPFEQPELTSYFEDLFKEGMIRHNKPVQRGFSKNEDVYGIARLGGI